ncbi:MAG TPA: hypothetical protein VMX55_10740 [candidate division Zixibacteria bacterium]|nr:hypothetical protein [candidate division Zixibacteria bacterium]
MKGKVKGERWAFAPRHAQQSFTISMITVVITIIISFSFGLAAKVLYAIPITIVLSSAILAGIIGIIYGSISLREKKERFGFLGVIFGILTTLWNVFMMIVLHWDAAFSVP